MFASVLVVHRASVLVVHQCWSCIPYAKAHLLTLLLFLRKHNLIRFLPGPFEFAGERTPSGVEIRVYTPKGKSAVRAPTPPVPHLLTEVAVTLCSVSMAVYVCTPAPFTVRFMSASAFLARVSFFGFWFGVSSLWRGVLLAHSLYARLCTNGGACVYTQVP